MSPRLSLPELYLRPQADERLLRLAAEGNERAFSILAERHRRALLAHAAAVVGWGREEDVVQQALLRAWTALGRGVEVRRVEGWLHAIVQNTALSELSRGQGATEQLPEGLADPRAGAEAAERRLEVQAMMEGIAALPERQRVALVATEIQGRSRTQIGEELGLSEGAVRQLVHRARAGVRAAVAALVPWPLLARLSRVGGRELDGGSLAHPTAASAALTGGAVKAGAALLAVGALGGGVLLHVIPVGHRVAARPVAAAHAAPTVGRQEAALAVLPASRTLPAAYAVDPAASSAAKPAHGAAPASPSARLGAARRGERDRSDSSPRSGDSAQSSGDSARSSGDSARSPGDSVRSSTESVPSSSDSAGSSSDAARSSGEPGHTTSSGDPSQASAELSSTAGEQSSTSSGQSSTSGEPTSTSSGQSTTAGGQSTTTGDGGSTTAGAAGE